MLFALDDTRAGNEKQPANADGNVADWKDEAVNSGAQSHKNLRVRIFVSTSLDQNVLKNFEPLRLSANAVETKELRRVLNRDNIPQRTRSQRTDRPNKWARHSLRAQMFPDQG